MKEISCLVSARPLQLFTQLVTTATDLLAQGQQESGSQTHSQVEEPTATQPSQLQEAAMDPTPTRDPTPTSKEQEGAMDPTPTRDPTPTSKVQEAAMDPTPTSKVQITTPTREVSKIQGLAIQDRDNSSNSKAQEVEGHMEDVKDIDLQS